MLILKTVRNVLIILALAALVVLVPGGGTAADLVFDTLSMAFLAAIAAMGVRIYRERRSTVYLLGDRMRTVFYVAIGLVVLTLTATHRLWSTGAGTAIWFALLAVAIYGFVLVYRESRPLS